MQINGTQKVALKTANTLKKPVLGETDRAWFSRLLQYPDRKWSGSLLTTPEPAWSGYNYENTGRFG